MDNNYIVTKSNALINANYNLSLQEQKIILILASVVQPNDEEFIEYKFEIKEILKILNIKNQSKYIELPKITKELMKKVFEIRDGDEIIQVAWLSSAKYKTNKGELTLKFSPDLKVYLLKLKDFYTSYRVGYALSLKSKYSLRLYELLKANEFKKTWVCSIKNLKKLLNATEKSYSTYQNFKNRTIIKAQNELKEKTDIEFEFEEIKTGRKVTDLKFYIKKNKKNKKENNLIEKENKIKVKKESKLNKINELEDNDIKYFYDLFKSHEVSIESIRRIINSANGDMEKIKNVYEYSKTQDIDNFVGFMIKMVEGNNFIEPKKSKRQIIFNDFTQREYDYDSLENKLLGWDNANQDENIKIEDNELKLDSINKIEDKEEVIYCSEIDKVRAFLEEQLITIFGDIKYKTWLKYGVDNLDINSKNIVYFYFTNSFSLKMFERDYKEVLIELINSVEPLLQLKTVVK